MKKVTVIIGRICSGKSNYAQKHYNDDKHLIVEVGQLVRDIKQQQQRVFDDSLHSELSKQICQILNEYYYQNDVVIVGIRQQEILQSVLQWCQDNLIQLVVKYLDVSYSTRYNRYLKRKDFKDSGQKFSDLDLKEVMLGVEQLIDYLDTLHIYYNVDVQKITN